MLILNKRTTAPATDSVALAYDERKRSRLKVTLASGAEAGIFLERGDHLHGGDRLAAEGNTAVVEILAAPEKLIEAVADSPLLFARAAYHLGNRHVPVQLGKCGLLIQADHVLAEMLLGLGCVVSEVEAPFDPEGGAYGSHAHGEAHAGGHDSHDHGPARPGMTSDPHPPDHGPHRSPAIIHEFK